MKYKKHCWITAPPGYWWQKRKLVKDDDLNKHRSASTVLRVDTIAKAYPKFMRCPQGTSLIWFLGHKEGRGHYVKEWTR